MYQLNKLKKRNLKNEKFLFKFKDQKIKDILQVMYSISFIYFSLNVDHSMVTTNDLQYLVCILLLALYKHYLSALDYRIHFL